jgi:hypothetical protein
MPRIFNEIRFRRCGLKNSDGRGDQTDPIERALEEKRAVKTTIVGGQPPGNDRPLASVPVGIEELLLMAAVDPAFRDALLDDRDRAVSASGVSLRPTERAILAAVDATTLQRMISNVGTTIPEHDRRTFIGRSAAALLALVGGGTLLATTGCPETKGARPDRPSKVTGIRPQRDPQPQPAPVVDVPPERDPAQRREQLQGETGARPDRPPPKEQPDAGLKKPVERPKPTRGIRPDRPNPTPAPPMGHAPDRPKKRSDSGRPDEEL